MTKDRFEQAYDQYKQQSRENAVRQNGNAQTEGQERITAVRKNEEGDIIAFKTAGGRENNLDNLDSF